MPNVAGPRPFIAQLRPSERVCASFAILNAQIGRTRSDKPYLRCLLRDRTGEMPGRMWSVDEAQLARVPPEGFVRVEGETQAYQGELQLIIQRLEPVEPSPEELRDLIPTASRPIEEMLAELRTLLDTLEHPAIRELACEFLRDERLMEEFSRCPAARNLHHACVGGLLEHTLTLLKLAGVVCPLYPRINRDLVLMGLFLHDIGKTRELSFERTFSYTDRGELIGHVVDGVLILREKIEGLARRGVRVPAAAVMVLEHIILSHHGSPEFGALKIPATPEAILVSMLDNLDAKTTIALAATRPERTASGELGGNFTERQWALNTRLYRPDPLAEATSPPS